MSASERQFLPPAVAVSTVAFALRPPEDALLGEGHVIRDSESSDTENPVTLWLPLVRRTRQPFSGEWALPGGPIPWNETLTESAEHTLFSTVGRDPGYLEQLYAFGDVGRSGQAQRLVTIAYWALYGESDLGGSAETLDVDGGRAGTRSARQQSVAGEVPLARWDDPEPSQRVAQATIARLDNVAWFSADRLPELAFDHSDIVTYALWRLRMKTEYAAVAHRFLGPVFTLAQLRQVHEAVIGHEVDPANFRRQVLTQGHLVDTGETQVGARHRPAKLYRFRGGGPDSPVPST
ncbi:MAG: NUDIX hydrolase [Leucobacter sp.]